MGDNGEEWFPGIVVCYNAVTKLHEIAYDGEEEHCFFNLLEDISLNDVIIGND